MGKLTRIFLKALFLLSSLWITPTRSYSQVYDAKVANYIKKVEHPFTFLEKCEKLGIKMVGNKELDSTYQWLLKLIKAEGYEIHIQKFLYVNDTLKNIEFIKRGESDSCIILGAHYDSWVGPGVNDNGTGDFALYQFAKLIKPLKTKYTIRFVYFSGEEPQSGFYGSRHYVSRINKDSVKIKFMINFDQLGGTIGQDNSAVKCEKDDKSAKQTQSTMIAETLANFYNLYTGLTAIITSAYSSDYVSFRDSGYVIAGIYQHSFFPYYHSENDLLTYIEFNCLMSTVKGALAAILYFSGAEVPKVDGVKNSFSHSLTVYNTNADLVIVNGEGYSLYLFDQFGREVYTQNKLMQESKVPLNSYRPGVYYAYLQSGKKNLCRKFIIYP